MSYLDKIKDDSIIAREYLKTQPEDVASTLNSMAKLCLKMNEVAAVKKLCDEDVNTKRVHHQVMQYGKDA